MIARFPNIVPHTTRDVRCGLRALFGVVVPLLAVATGCSRRSDPDSTAQPPSAVESQANDSLRLAAPWNRPDLVATPSPRSADVVPTRLSAFTVRQNQIDDPTRDGWSSEAWANAAQERMYSLVSLVLGSAPAEQPDDALTDQLRSILSGDFRCGPLRPTKLSTVFTGAELRVERAQPVDLEAEQRRFTGAAGFWRAAATLRQAFFAQPGARFEVKPVGVETAPGALSTRFLFSASTEAGFEHHATWLCRWKLPETPPGQGARPMLDELTVADVEEIVADKPYFTECTAAVFADEPIYTAQLLPSIHTWLKSIDISVDPDFEGMQGIAVGDVDGDGLDDVYLCQGGGLPNRLLLQNSRDGSVRDVSAAAGVDFIETTRSALFVDFDNDGDQDLALATDGMLLVLSNDGTGRFAEAARFPDITLAFSLAAADYDADGDVDLYACRHFSEAHKSVGQLPNPVPYQDANNGGRNVCLRNDGQFKFVDATVEVGLDANNRRWSYAASWEDYDNDGDVDLYVANDFGRNNLYRNDGGRFVDVAAAAGVEDVASGMSASWGDYDADGWMDLYVSNMFSSAGSRITYQRAFKGEAPDQTKSHYQRLARGNSLFQNRGDGTFRDVSVDAHVTMGRWAWGSKFVDFNNDGREDILIANGYVTGEDTGDL